MRGSKSVSQSWNIVRWSQYSWFILCHTSFLKWSLGEKKEERKTRFQNFLLLHQPRCNKVPEASSAIINKRSETPWVPHGSTLMTDERARLDSSSNWWTRMINIFKKLCETSFVFYCLNPRHKLTKTGNEFGP